MKYGSFIGSLTLTGKMWQKVFVNRLRQVFIFQIRIWLSFGTHDKFKGCRRRLLIFVFAEKKLAEVIHSSKERQNLLVKLEWKYVNNVWYLKTTENWLVSRYDILTYPSKMKLNFRKGLANTFIFSEFGTQFFSRTLTSWHACVIESIPQPSYTGTKLMVCR